MNAAAPLPVPPPVAEGFTKSTEVPLYWRDDGPRDASPLLLLHGGPGAHHDYLYPQCLALAKHHRLITYDQRGSGRSKSDDPTTVTWQTQVRDLAQVVTEFELSAYTLVGYSWGALLAMLYAIEATSDSALRAPLNLVLISPAPITREWRNDFERALSERQNAPAIKALRDELNNSALRERDYGAYRQRAFELSVAGYFSDPARAAQLTPFRVTGRVQQSVWESLGDFDLRDSLTRVSVRSLVIHGRQDPIPLASAAAAAVALHGELVALDACGHVPYVEQPDALFAAIEAFLK